MNFLPIEDFLNKSRIARKGNQQSISLSAKEYNDLADSIALVMTRLSSVLDQTSTSANNAPITVKMDGGKF